MPKWKPEFWEGGGWSPMYHWDGRKAVFQIEENARDFIYEAGIPHDVLVRVSLEVSYW